MAVVEAVVTAMVTVEVAKTIMVVVEIIKIAMETTNKENANCVMMEGIASQHGRGLDVWKFTK